MEGDAVKLACRYSWVCERAILAGQSHLLEDFFRGKSKIAPEAMKGILNILQSYQFYRAIARINMIDNPCNLNVISHYWIGIPPLKGELWHNFTTLLPIVPLPIEVIKTEMVDSCMVHAGIVLETLAGKVKIMYMPVVKNGKKLVLSEKLIEKEVLNHIPVSLKKDDWASIHFSNVIEKISPEEGKNLQTITRRSLEKFNKLRARRQ